MYLIIMLTLLFLVGPSRTKLTSSESTYRTRLLCTDRRRRINCFLLDYATNSPPIKLRHNLLPSPKALKRRRAYILEWSLPIRNRL